MTSRHPRVTERVFLGGDKNDRVSELTFLSPRPPENHDRPLRRKTTPKTKKRDTIVFAFVFLLTYYLSFSWTTSGRVHNTSVSSERALELRAKYAKLAKAEKERALKRYGYHGGGHSLGGNHIGPIFWNILPRFRSLLRRRHRTVLVRLKESLAKCWRHM